MHSHNHINHRFIGELSMVDWSILIIRRKQPYIDWANSFEDDGPKYDGAETGPSAYLIPYFESIDNVKGFVAANFGAIFEEELASWMEVPETWPDFTLDNFGNWFSVEYIDMVYDLTEPEALEPDRGLDFNA